MNSIRKNASSAVQTLSNAILNGLKEQLQDNPRVTEIRGFGLMIGIELNEPCGQLVEAAKSEGLLINVTAANVIRLLPPFILTDDEAETLVACVVKLIQQIAQ